MAQWARPDSCHQQLLPPRFMPQSVCPMTAVQPLASAEPTPWDDCFDKACGLFQLATAPDSAVKKRQLWTGGKTGESAIVDDPGTQQRLLGIYAVGRQRALSGKSSRRMTGGAFA